MDLGKWLSDIGLGQYEALFIQNAIDADILPNLTADDLKDMGIAAVGHRRKLLMTIDQMSQAHRQRHQGIAYASDLAERRQLTVMFCDVVNSTALSTQLDPEDMGSIFHAFQEAVVNAVARFDGNVAQFQGDGALVYFGFPHAHEDDAERAARASLALVESLNQLAGQGEFAIKMRIGIATGLVVVGELIGTGEAQRRDVVGETPNLAARLQAIAEPGQIVVAESTRRLLRRTFELKALPEQKLRGFDGLIPAWLVVREAPNINRFEALLSGTMTPFVGREQEVAKLLDHWHDALEGEAKIVSLSGEAGIGKSRILLALRELIGRERHVVVRYQCSPHHVNDALYPIIGQIAQDAGFVTGEPDIARLRKIEAFTGSVGLNNDEITPYVAALMSIPAHLLAPTAEVAPTERKERVLAALVELFLKLAEHAPLLALVEDAHWIDPTSLELFNRLIEKVQHRRVLLITTFRPEFAAPWSGRANASAIVLSRLGRRQAVTMINRVAGGIALPAEVMKQVVAKTDGVPLFIEELIKNVLESGLISEKSGRYVLTSALTPLAIPSTLHDSLMARLDRLASVKEIAQIGAAIGRQFTHRLLEAIAPISGPALNNALRQLLAAELIYERGADPDKSYIFKHALVQETAYASLLRGRRQGIHANIAMVLRDQFTHENIAPAVIAHHFTEAGLAEPASGYWLAAAELALSRSAPAEAEHHASAGLALIARVPDGPARRALELGLLVSKANALVPLKSNTAAETVATLMAAKTHLDAGVGTDLQRFSVLSALCAAHTLSARLKPALDLAHEIVLIADRQKDTTYRLVGYRQLGTLQFYAGDHRAALASMKEAGKYRDALRQKALSHQFGWDPGLAVLCFEALVRLSLGLLDSAAHIGAQVRSELPGHGHVSTMAMGKFCAVTWPALVLGDLEVVERSSAELVAYCTEQKVEQIRLLTNVFYAYACAMREPGSEKIVKLRAALHAQQKSGGLIGNSIQSSLLAETMILAGDITGAKGALRDGFAYVETSGERYWLADLHRLSGHVALKGAVPDHAGAQASFKSAIAIAKGQGAHLLQLRAATDLAELWRQTGSKKDPQMLVATILAQIEGGERTRDVRGARALLAACI